MKAFRCYGRQNTAYAKKEKSFIRKFFDEDKSLKINSCNKSYNAYIQGNQLICEQEDNANVPKSPVLFKDSYDEDLSKKCLALNKTNLKMKNLKKLMPNNKKRNKKVKRNPKRKAKNNILKFNNCIEPQWSEFYEHNFTLERLGKNKIYSNVLQLLSDNANMMSPITMHEKLNHSPKYHGKKMLHRVQNRSGLRDFERRVTSPILNNYVASQQSIICSSGELFSESHISNCRRNVKKGRNLQDMHNSEEQHGKTNKKYLYNLEKKITDLYNCHKFTENHLQSFDDLEALSYITSPNVIDDLHVQDNMHNTEKYANASEIKVDYNSVLPGVSSTFDYNLMKPKSPGKIITSTPVIRRMTAQNLLSTSTSYSPNIEEPLKCNDIHSHIFYPDSETCYKNDDSRSKRSTEALYISISNNASLPNYRKPESFSIQNKAQITPPRRSTSLLIKSTSDFLANNGQNSLENDKANLLKLCDQDSIINFSDAYDLSKYKVKKIGEGTYGEVFILTKGKIQSVLKIIPISEDAKVDSYQSLTNVLAEVKISKCLSDLRNSKYNQTKNFIKFNRAITVSGAYPNGLLSAWDCFKDEKSSYNIRPDIYDDKQLFVILDLEYGGKDMSVFNLRNAVEAESVLKQITTTLAVAEEQFLFEHRDLHLGNILIRRNNSKYISFKIRGHDVTFKSHGLHVTIIDFTLSRLYENGCIYYNDLALDDSIFNGSGDFQFDVYRCMKEKIRNQWHECLLYSNVLWLNFFCAKLKEYDYCRPSTQIHKKGMKAIELFENQVKDCNCALECINSCGICTLNFEIDPERGVRSSKSSIRISRSLTQKSKSKICI